LRDWGDRAPSEAKSAGWKGRPLRIGAHAVYSGLSRVADGVVLRAEELIA